MGALSTVDHAVDLLFALSASAEPEGVTALSRRLGLPKANVHRLLATLLQRGLVEQDERRRYLPGSALVALGLQRLDRDPVTAAARGELEAAAAELGETVFLAGLRGGQLVVLDKAEGSGFLRAAPRIGETVPLHATAVGKLALAFAPDEVALGGAELRSFTATTATSHAALDAEVRRAALRGWAENREEWIAGLSVVAVPVLRAGRLVGALALAAATGRIESIGRLRTATRLQAAAKRIEARLVTPLPRTRSAEAGA